jgi:hypothetical protein
MEDLAHRLYKWVLLLALLTHRQRRPPVIAGCLARLR